MSNNEEIEPVIEQKAVVSASLDEELSTPDSEGQELIDSDDQAPSDAESQSSAGSSFLEEQVEEDIPTREEMADQELSVEKESVEKISPVREEMADQELSVKKESVEKISPIEEKQFDEELNLKKEPLEKELDGKVEPVEEAEKTPNQAIENPVKESSADHKTSNPEPKEQPVVKEKKAWKSEQTGKAKPQAVKDVKLEITNPDDIDIDEKGQTKLF
ncbi:MAG: hypothetical protein EOP48_32990 [Sphingobacteriales bacterium]|nr:MAG: hypothetical protein EOP48_32990 [Sphingobacteriales bacterium]